MMRRISGVLRVFVLAFVWMLLFILPGVLLGQAELTQTYTSPDGKISIRYPEGWVVIPQGGAVAFGTSEDLLTQPTFESGQAALVMQFLPACSAQLSLDETAKMFTGAGGFSEPEKFVVAGFSAVQVRGAGQSLGLNADVLFVIVDVGEATLGIIIGAAVPGELSAFESTFMAMLETLTYGESAPQTVENTAAGLMPITPDNAGQVAEVITLRGHVGKVVNVAFARDGSTLFSSGVDKSLWLWDLTGSEIVGLPREQHVFGDNGSNIAVSPDGMLLASDNVEGKLVLRDAATGEMLNTLASPNNSRIQGVAFDPGGTTLVSIGLDGAVRIWDVAGGSQIRQIDAGTPTSLAFSPDGTTIAVGQLNSGEILLINADTGQTIAILSGHTDTVNALAFSPDGRLLASAGAFSDGTIRLWNVAAGESLAIFGGSDGRVLSVAFNPDGTLLAAAAQSFRLWNVETREEIELAALQAGSSGSQSPVTSIAFSPDGTQLALGRSDGTIQLVGTTVDGGALNIPEVPASGPVATTAPTTSETAITCTITAPNNVNLRSGPGTNFDRAGSLAAGQTAEVDGQTQGADGMTWYRLTLGSWARSDVVNAPATCGNVMAVTL